MRDQVIVFVLYAVGIIVGVAYVIVLGLLHR